MENVISALSSVICGLDNTVPSDSILAQLSQCNSLILPNQMDTQPTLSLIQQQNTPQETDEQNPKVQFYGWDPRQHCPMVTFQTPSCPSPDKHNDTFIADTLRTKMQSISNVISAVNTILQTRHVYFVDQ